MRIKYNITAVVTSIYLAVSLGSSAQIGSLDTSFGSDGIVTTSVGIDDDFAQSVVVQADNKIIVAGYSDNGSQNVFAMTRYNTDGSLDISFGNGGIVFTQIGNSGNRAHAGAIQSDGKIVLAGYAYLPSSSNDFALARYNNDGTLDTSFGIDGVVTTSFGEFTNDRAFCLAFNDDGAIFVAGYHTDIVSAQRDFALVKYHSDGTIDNTFGTSGIATQSIASGNDEVRSVVVQNDGKIVVAGYSFDFAERVFALIRYNANGSLDLTFDSDGIVTTSIGGVAMDAAAYSSVLQPDGKILVSGYTHGESYDFATVRYNNDGSLDNSFGSNGIAVTSFELSASSSDEAASMVLQNDGKIIVAGHADYDFSMARYNSDGTLDMSFNVDGLVTTDVSSSDFDDRIEDIALQTDGKILAVGHSGNGANIDFTLARYNVDATIEVDQVSTDNSKILVFPNPFTSTMTIRTDSVSITRITLLNAIGSVVKVVENLKESTIVLDREDLPSGLYTLRMEEDNNTIDVQRVVIID